MTTGLDLNAIARISAAQLMDCLVEGTLIALFCGLVLYGARRRSSGTRFAVWFSALMATVAMPCLAGTWWSVADGAHAGGIVSRAAITLPSSWASYLFAAWAAIAACGLIRIVVGLFQLHTVRQHCRSVDPNLLDRELRETLERHRAMRPVDLCMSDRMHVPTAIGFFKPAVVIPRWLMQELSAVELNQVVLHELAHVRRWDDWTNLAQKIVKSLLFFHPAVWWIEKRVSLEREMACDDAVLAETASPRAYAECLARLAERSFVRRSMALAQAAVGRIHQTSLRVAQILDGHQPRSTGGVWKQAVSLVAVLAIICAAAASHAPRLIAFDEGGVSNVAAPIAQSAPMAGSREVLPAVSSAATVHPMAKPATMTARVGGTAAKVVTSNLRHKEYRTAHADYESSEQIAPRPATWRDSGASAPVFKEAVFVVVEGDGFDSAGQAVYQIRVWRITVLHPSDQSIRKTIPRKET